MGTCLRITFAQAFFHVANLHERKLDIIGLWGKINQNHNDIPLTVSKMVMVVKKQQQQRGGGGRGEVKEGEGGEEERPSLTVPSGKSWKPVRAAGWGLPHWKHLQA